MPDEQIPPAESRDLGPSWTPPDRPASPAGADTGNPSPEAASGWPPPPGISSPVPSGSSWQSPGYPPWQPPLPNNRSRRVAWLAASAAVVVAALIAASIGYIIGHQHGGTQATAAAGSSCGTGKVPQPSATLPAGAALMARLLPAPSGAWGALGLKQGELSLDDYTYELYSTSPDANQQLTALCFQVAVNRAWIMPSGTEASVWLIQFGGRADARSYTLQTEESESAVPANTVKFPVPRVADGTGIATPNLDKLGNTYSQLLGDRGDVAILIHLWVPFALNNALAVQMLQEQNTRL